MQSDEKRISEVDLNIVPAKSFFFSSLLCIKITLAMHNLYRQRKIHPPSQFTLALQFAQTEKIERILRYGCKKTRKSNSIRYRSYNVIELHSNCVRMIIRTENNETTRNVCMQHRRDEKWIHLLIDVQRVVASCCTRSYRLMNIRETPTSHTLPPPPTHPSLPHSGDSIGL